MENMDAQLINQIMWNEPNVPNGNFENDAEEDEDRDGDGILDGGVAKGSEETTERKSSSECDLVRCRLRTIQ